ncbi:MAG TPA: type II secretion system protein GspM [Kofleriaceae bacterium]|jgi:hypothetical protein
MAVTDRASEFWNRISPRERILVLVGAIAAPIVIAIWLGSAIADGLDDIATRNDEMRDALHVLDDLKQRGGPVMPADDAVATMGTEILSLNTYLSNAATKAGFQLKGTTPRPEVHKNGFVTSSVSLTVSDVTLDQFQKFLQSIETQSKVVYVTHLDISRHDYKAHDKLDANLEVSTYAREAPAKSDGGSGSAGSDQKAGG